MKQLPSLRKPSFFYGWVIVGVSLITITLSTSMRSSFSVFYVAILKEFGWSRAETAGAMSLAMVTAAGGGLLAGWFVDRLGPRRFLPMGAVILSLGLVASSQIRSLWQFYVSFGLLTAGGIAALWYVPQGVMISRWFVSRRSTAFGIAVSGIGVGSLLLLPLGQGLIERIGWRNTYLVLAVSMAVILIPLNGILLRSSPEEMGLHPDGEDPAISRKKGESRNRIRMVVKNERWAATEWSVPLASRTPQFWILVVLNITNGFRMNLLHAHQVIYLVDKGFSAMLAATVFGFTYLCGTAGSLLWGRISDRCGREIAQSGVTLLMVVGLLALMRIQSQEDWVLLTLFALIYGIGWGGASPVGTSIHADMFQGKHFGTILGTVNIGFGLGGALGAWFGGYVYDLTSSYNLALHAVIILSVISAVLVWVLAPRKIRAPMRIRDSRAEESSPLRNEAGKL